MVVGACWAVGVVLEQVWQDGAESRTGVETVSRHEEGCLEGWVSLEALTLARLGPGWAEEAVEAGDLEH